MLQSSILDCNIDITLKPFYETTTHWGHSTGCH